MLNPTFFQLDAEDGEWRLEVARLDRADRRLLDDIGMTEADWARATGASGAGTRVATLLESLSRLLVRQLSREVPPAAGSHGEAGIRTQP